MYNKSSCKVPVIFANFNFLLTLSKNPQMSNLVKICLVGAEVFHVDGRTDMTTLTVASRNFVKVPKNPLFTTSINDRHTNPLDNFMAT